MYNINNLIRKLYIIYINVINVYLFSLYNCYIGVKNNKNKKFHIKGIIGPKTKYH